MTRDELRDWILLECDICIHLHGKIPPGGMEYRQSPAQRSTLELLRYLSYCGIGGALFARDGVWDGYKSVAERAAEMGPGEFPAAMARQKEELAAFFAEFTDADLAQRPGSLPMGPKTALGQALVSLPLRWLVGYRMQLFLNAKAAGNTEIWTPDCWMGVDVERPAPA